MGVINCENNRHYLSKELFFVNSVTINALSTELILNRTVENWLGIHTCLFFINHLSMNHFGQLKWIIFSQFCDDICLIHWYNTYSNSWKLVRNSYLFIFINHLSMNHFGQLKWIIFSQFWSIYASLLIFFTYLNCWIVAVW